MSKTYLIYGVSKGLGKAMASKLPSENDIIYGVSRTKPLFFDGSNKRWIEADLSKPTQAVSQIADQIDSAKINYLIYNVGIWEKKAFIEEYDFNESSAEEIDNLINTNITSCILSIQSLLPNLRLSKDAKIILIGSTWGLENHQGKEVAFSASKFALRGVVHALRESLRPDHIGISILNLGYLATEYEYETPIEQIIEENDRSLIPLTDVIAAIQFILSTSSASCVKEITMPAMNDENV